MPPLSDLSDEDLRAELRRRQESWERKTALSSPEFRRAVEVDPVGTWQVTTEGDCEGRTTTSLGVWTGHIADIAFTLSDRVYYTLQFKRIDPGSMVIDPAKSQRDEVSIRLDCSTGTWDLGSELRVIAYREILHKIPASVLFDVKKSEFYSSVYLVRRK